MAKYRQLLDGARQGRNDFGKLGYNGPCPPRGAPHRYFFKLYALDYKVKLKLGARKGELERAMKRHVLAMAELIGRFQHWTCVVEFLQGVLLATILPAGQLDAVTLSMKRRMRR